MQIVDASATDLFVGTEDAPRQVARVRLRGTADAREVRVVVRGPGLDPNVPLSVAPLAPGAEAQVEVGVGLGQGLRRGEVVAAEAVVLGDAEAVTPFDFVVAEPGWRMFMIAHFHYDPVWWNTQAAFTEAWGQAIAYRQPFQEPSLALVRAHLDMARRDPLYKFVLAELDYLKPYWDAYPEDRDYVRRLLRESRLELVGATYNEPNTNLTSAESTIRSAIYGIGYQRDVLGGAPATAWQLDVFGHDPQFPGIMADAGATSSSWARGPFHEWGPHWFRGPARVPFAALAPPPYPEMQFPTEFDWVAPSGRALLTSFMANHYSAGWWMDTSTSLEEAEAQVHALFSDLVPLATTRNVLLPVGTDHSPPNRWMTAIARDWAARYVWPKFIPAVPREFFEAVRAERAATGRPFPPQTRDMNPVYTGKDVSFIDTKQAQRLAENTLVEAETFATSAWLGGDRYPHAAIDKAWRQLLFGAHHDGITGSESDQVYLDLMAGWREAFELGRGVRDAALASLDGRLDLPGEGLPVVVTNSLSWARSDVARAELRPHGGWPARGLRLLDGDGRDVPFAVEAIERAGDGGLESVRISFVAHDVPPVGHRVYRAVPADVDLEAHRWRPTTDATPTIENEAYAVSVDAARGGAIDRIVDRRAGRDVLRPGGLANELLAYREYPNHPLFGEGPWHLTPDGRVASAAAAPAGVTVLESPIGRRIEVEGRFAGCGLRQSVTLWQAVARIDLRTRLDDWAGADTLFRVRFDAAVEGGRPVAETANAVIGRSYGRPNVDVADVPFTLDNPAYNWFAVGSTARIVAGDDRLAIGVAEVVAPDEPALDDPLRALVVALVRAGVTSTLARADGPRYGILHIDSNLPDVRIAIGGPAENAFTAAVLGAADAAGEGYRAELERVLAAAPVGVLLVPPLPRPAGTQASLPDVRSPRDLPVLVVAARDAARLADAVRDLAADVADATIEASAAASHPSGSLRLDDYTVGVLNRGLPGSTVDAAGSLYLSLLRSSSGWPSGVWIDPPRRSTPDGANFEFEHWSHDFEYAIVAGPGDWREAGLVRAGHELNRPLLARATASGDRRQTAVASQVTVDPPSVVLGALKAGGNPLARMASPTDERAVVLRLYESLGRATRARIRFGSGIEAAARTDLLEGAERPLAVDPDGTVALELEAYEIATVRIGPVLAGRDAFASQDRDLGPTGEVAQPVFADYWMHNKGAAPVGYQPVTVGIRPWQAAGPGPFRLPVIVASERTDGVAPGSVRLEVPPGWRASPAERPFSLAPGAHLAFETLVEPAEDALPGRYFVAARIVDEAGQAHEDVVTIDLLSGSDTGQPAAAGSERPGPPVATRRSASLTAAIGRALRGGEPLEDPSPLPEGVGRIGGELEADLVGDGVSVPAGASATLRVRLRNCVASEIRGEAQLISPYDAWSFTSPWTQGFTVPAGAEGDVTFAVGPAADQRPGRWWALVKVMYFGRVLYTASVPVEVLPRGDR